MDGGNLGTDAVLKLNGQDVSGYLNSSGLPMTVDSLESTTFGDKKKRYRPGLADGTISLGGIADATIDGILFGLVQTADVPWQYYPFGDSGAAGTNVEYSGNANLTKYDLNDSGPDKLEDFSAEFQQTGDITRALV